MCQFITVKELPALGYLYTYMKCVYVRTDLYMKLHTELGRLWFKLPKNMATICSPEMVIFFYFKLQSISRKSCNYYCFTD